MTIATLIDKTDSVELVADAIAALLKSESIAQVALATSGGKPDPTLWDLRVFQERMNAWESWLEHTDTDVRPIVNVWVESQQIEMARSDPHRRQVYTGRYNVDVYGRGLPGDDGGSGHTPGDLAAAKKRDHGAKLVRNILAASTSWRLGLSVVHGGPLVTGFDYFIPAVEQRYSPNVRAVRLQVSVTFNETSPQYVDTADTLEQIWIDLHRDEISGEILAELDIDTTPAP